MAKGGYVGKVKLNRMNKTMTVSETLAAIISNWPSLHTSRLSALRNIFTGDCDDWSKGCPNPYRTSAIYSRDDFDTPEEIEKLRAKARSFEESLSNLKDLSDKKFIRTNAAFIATATYGPFHAFQYVPTFSMYDLNRISPETLNAEWREALIEFCKAILSLREDFARSNPNGYTAETIERRVIELKNAQATAREALNRLGLANEQEKKDRDDAIQKLRFEAAKLGFKLEKVDPANVFA